MTRELSKQQESALLKKHLTGDCSGHTWPTDESDFIAKLEKRHMSDWTAEEMVRYNDLTGQSMTQSESKAAKLLGGNMKCPTCGSDNPYHYGRNCLKSADGWHRANQRTECERFTGIPGGQCQLCGLIAYEHKGHVERAHEPIS